MGGGGVGKGGGGGGERARVCVCVCAKHRRVKIRRVSESVSTWESERNTARDCVCARV